MAASATYCIDIAEPCPVDNTHFSASPSKHLVAPEMAAKVKLASDEVVTDGTLEPASMNDTMTPVVLSILITPDFLSSGVEAALADLAGASKSNSWTFPDPARDQCPLNWRVSSRTLTCTSNGTDSFPQRLLHCHRLQVHRLIVKRCVLIYSWCVLAV